MLAGRRSSFTSIKLHRAHKQPVRIQEKLPTVLPKRQQKPEAPYHDPVPVAVSAATREYTSLSEDPAMGKTFRV